MELKVLLGSLLRHLLTTVGGGLVANGLVTEADAQSLVGGAVALLGLLLSLKDKKKK